MKDVISYNGFVGMVHFSAEDDVFHGKLEGVNDLITFEGQSVEELKKAFQDAVEGYLIICKEIGKDPHKSYKGSFNIRINPDLHQFASQKSTEEGVSLNQLIERAIQKYVNPASQ